MQAAVLVAPGRVELVDREAPEPFDDQVLVEVTQCGVCGSDVDKWRGASPQSLPNEIGHEIAGVVSAVGSRVTDLEPGDRVVAWTADGRGFAERVVAEARHCVPVRSDVAFPAIAEPLGCILNTVELVHPVVGDDVVIAGATGFMGLLLVAISALAGGRRIIASGRRPKALAFAEALGATDVVNTETDSLVEAVAEITGGRMADVSYECVGATDGLRLAGRTVRMSGKLGVVGYHQGEPRPTEWGLWNGMGLHVYNAHFRPAEQCVDGMRRAVRLIEGGVLDPYPFLTHTFSLGRIDDAFRTAASKPEGFVKAAVVA